ncbi:MAG: hypothetical protein J6X66_13585 [Lachnospiraceae bacterium]|nr:hypothetical protein [Lachnospiraceae bacterium]
MEKLLELLKDGRSRTIEMLAIEMNTGVEEVKRDIEFLERMGMIKRVGFSVSNNCGHSCNSCSGCGTGKAACPGCMPPEGFENMGVMWEVMV